MLRISENLQAQKPVIQGGMAIRVSLAPLASAVANCGGIGLIAISGMPEQEIRDQIQAARSLITAPGGLLGVNIMYAAREFNKLVETAIDEKIDLIVFGAGFSRDIFSIGREAGVPIAPIVSSPKLAVLAKRLGATTVIVESGEAGGHIGTCLTIRDLIPKVRAALDAEPTPEYNNMERTTLIAAGGITSGADIAEVMRQGADGVQMATRFVLSKECDVSDKFKELFLKSSKEDLLLIHSPVGMPARAIKTSFSEKIADGTVEPSKECHKCLKVCTRSFCIIKALQKAREGDLENGLFFTGGNVEKYNDIISVAEIFERLESEYSAVIAPKALATHVQD